MKLYLLLLLITILTSICKGQVIEDTIVNESSVSAWIVPDKNVYEGIYFFGTLLSSSYVCVAIDKDLICIQGVHFTRNPLDEGGSDWIPQYTNYHNVRIERNNFYSTETNGEFIIYEKNGVQIFGLKLLNPPNGKAGPYEIGIFGDEEKTLYLNGKYGILKFDILQPSDLNNKSAKELKTMRNEIYARYGYLFAEGGEIEPYFLTQGWYLGLKNSADALLTDIEKENIKRITLAEEAK